MTNAARHGRVQDMQVRLTKKLAERIDDVDLTQHVVGDLLDVPERDAACLVAEGWAVLDDAPDGSALDARSVTASVTPLQSASAEKLLEDVERLATSILDHEHSLTALAAALDADTEGSPGASVALRTAAGDFTLAYEVAELDRTGELVAIVRELCHSAREQRKLAETVMARMVSDVTRAVRPRTGRPCVLVVDGSDDSRDLAMVVLETSGVDAISATNGLEGLIVAHEARPAVVLMDIAMPVLDGIEAARLLKASAVTRDLSVIAYTAKPGFEHGPHADLFADVLSKPASPEAILASVRRFIDDGCPIDPLAATAQSAFKDVPTESA